MMKPFHYEEVDGALLTLMYAIQYILYADSCDTVK